MNEATRKALTDYIVEDIESDNYFDHGTTYALCTREAEYEVGETNLQNSYRWDDGDKTDEELDGVCATKIDVGYDSTAPAIAKAVERAANTNEQYCGTWKYLIAGDIDSYGEDVGEVLLTNVIVLCKFRA